MPLVAYRVTRARRKFIKYPQIIAELGRTLDMQVKPHFIRQFDKIVANWEHQPEFKGRKFITADAIKVNVFPAGPHKQIYIFVTLGTRPHRIRPRRTGGKLAFMWGGPGSYQPKTTPAPSWGGPGVVRGGEMTFAREVRHPGTVARNFEKYVAQRNKAWFSRTMENAWRRAIRRL